MKKHIEKWLKEELINSQQAKQMLADIEKDSSEKSSKRIIFTFSVIGAVLVGIGVILFVATNWQIIPSLAKILILAILTFASAFGGYYLEFENKHYPKTGSSLLFLSTFLFGALIFLTAQIYHIDSARGVHILVLLWTLSVLPYIYLFRSRPVAVLISVLFIVWISLFIYKHNNIYYIERTLPLIYCLSGILLFCFGKVNEFIRDFVKISRVFEKIGIFIIFISIFTLTFSYFSNSTYGFVLTPFLERITETAFLSSIIIFLASFFFDPAKNNNIIESILMTALFSGFILFFGHIYISRLSINLFFAISVLALILIGYQKKEMFYVNLGILWLIIFITTKYFDVFWRLLPRSLFFLAGGIFLIGSALFFEHKRRKIKAEFDAHES